MAGRREGGWITCRLCVEAIVDSALGIMLGGGNAIDVCAVVDGIVTPECVVDGIAGDVVCVGTPLSALVLPAAVVVFCRLESVVAVDATAV